MKQNTNHPFANKAKQAKFAFKKIIDEMSDEEFVMSDLLFIEFLENQVDSKSLQIHLEEDKSR